MRRFILFCIGCAGALAAVSCQDDFSQRHTGGQLPTIPFDFDWKTTRDVALTVGSPTVGEGSPDFAFVNVYASPVLSEENMLARGLIRDGQPFNAVVTLPASTPCVYVQTVVPDGRRAAQMVNVTSAELSVAGMRFGIASAGAFAPAAAPRVQSSLDVPFTESIPATFDRTIERSEGYFPLDGNAEKTYYIPAGVTIEGDGIGLGGWTGDFPTLYVAGKLVFSKDAALTLTRLVVLEGGEVEIRDELVVNAQDRLTDKAALYVCKGGKLRTGGLLVDRAVAVVDGELEVVDDTRLLPRGQFYVTSEARFETDDMEVSAASVHTDGKWTADEVTIASGGEFVNYENGVLKADEFTVSNAVLTQKGYFEVEKLELENRASVNNQCRMVMNEFESTSRGVRLMLGGGSLFAVRDEVEMAYLQVDMAKYAMFLIEKLDDDDKDFRNNTFNGPAIGTTDSTPVAVLKTANGHGGNNSVYGLIEIVCDARNNHKIFSQIKDGATLVQEQTVDIPATGCNGGAGNITPAPVEPEDGFEVKGAVYTYCFEDGWPWFGDYDMNDLVVAASVDRRMQGDKVAAIRINWETRASGADNTIAFAVMLDKVAATGIASVVSTHTPAEGTFTVENGMEPDNEQAVIPLFNSVSEVLGRNNAYINTESGMPTVDVQRHTTTITFTAPRSQADVTESALNYFLVATRSDAAGPERWREIHLSGYRPTAHAVVAGFNTVVPDMPYKYYAQGGDLSNNGLMWGLMIPGEFRYPSEMNDIRTVYSEFLPWAKSGGAQSQTWYAGNADAEKIYR